MRHVNARDTFSAATAQLSPRGLETFRAAIVQFLLDRQGQDFIEYALMAGFVATIAATISPTVASGAITMFSKITSVIVVAGG
jgi:Flp pilus assembly pilin Flp